VQTHVLERGDDPEALARAADDADALGMAGGAGSMGAVAGVAAERGVPFVCIPFGTRNHFARDAGLPEDPIEALSAFDGTERRVDIGRAGDRVFLNNVSLGLYAELVHRRERHRRRRDALARLRALLKLATDRGRNADFVVDGTPVDAQVVLAANNAYELDVFDIGERQRLDEGRLYVYVAHGWRPRTWEERSCTQASVDVASHHLKAAVDGEPALFDTPLELSVEAGALRLLVPAG
jgi:diacylglycerol kinase family enzyme